MARKIFYLILVLVLALSFQMTQAANSNVTFTITNYTGRAITEVYLYPTYSSSWGKARNLSGWIRSNSSGPITVTTAEVNRNCSWSLRVGFNASYYVTYVEWEDVDLASYIGGNLEIYETGSGWEISLADDSDFYGGGSGYNGGSTYNGGSSYTAMEFKLFNNSGRAITEVYLYPAGSSSWGKCRNVSRIADGSSTTIRLTSTELRNSRGWCLRIGFDYPRYVSYCEWSDVDLNDYLGGTMEVGCYFDGYWYINSSSSL